MVGSRSEDLPAYVFWIVVLLLILFIDLFFFRATLPVIILAGNFIQPFDGNARSLP